MHGENWHQHIGARHWINEEWKRFKNKLYSVGNRDGFWPQYGRSVYYKRRDGPAAFHAFFKALARPISIPSIATLTEKISNVVLEPAAFPSLGFSPANRGTRSVIEGPWTRGRAATLSVSAESTKITANARSSADRKDQTAPGTAALSKGTVSIRIIASKESHPAHASRKEAPPMKSSWAQIARGK